jgi:hypothetical protein
VAWYTAAFPAFWQFTSALRTVAILGFVGIVFSNRFKSARTASFNRMNRSASLNSLRLPLHSLNLWLQLISPEAWPLLWGAGPATDEVAQKLRNINAMASLFI